MTTSSFNLLKQDIRSLTSSIQESVAAQIERIDREKLTDLDGNRYRDYTHETLSRLFTQFKLDLHSLSTKKTKREIVFRSSLNYISKFILLKYLNDRNNMSDFQFNVIYP